MSVFLCFVKFVLYLIKNPIFKFFFPQFIHSFIRIQKKIFFQRFFKVKKIIFVRFNGSGPVLEQHCYPSSLKFDLVVVTRDGFLTASHLGIQRRVLNELACRPSSLVQPSQLYQICLMAGLAQVCQL